MTAHSFAQFPTLAYVYVRRMVDSFQVFFKEIDAGACSADHSNIECLLQQMITTSGFVVCPGIRDYPASIHGSLE